MARYRGTVISTRPAEETFDYMADFANAAQWDPGTADAERLDDGPVGLGSTSRPGSCRSTTGSSPTTDPAGSCCSGSRTPSGPRTP